MTQPHVSGDAVRAARRLETIRFVATIAGWIPLIFQMLSAMRFSVLFGGIPLLVILYMLARRGWVLVELRRRLRASARDGGRTAADDVPEDARGSIDDPSSDEHSSSWADAAISWRRPRLAPNVIVLLHVEDTTYRLRDVSANIFEYGGLRWRPGTALLDEGVFVADSSGRPIVWRGRFDRAINIDAELVRARRPRSNLRVAVRTAAHSVVMPWAYAFFLPKEWY